MAKVRKMFTGGNTSQGFYSLHHNIISEDRNALYILKGMPGGGKSSLMKEVGNKISSMEIDVEFHHCPSDANSIDGLVINKYKIAIVDGTAPHIMDPVYPGLTDKTIDLAKFINSDKLIDKQEIIKKAKKDNKNAYRKAFSYFNAAGIIHGEIEAANRQLVNEGGVNKEILKLTEKVFSKNQMNIKLNGFKERHLLSTANTPGGFIDYTDSILAGVGDIYYVSGDIGTGTSRLMSALSKTASLMNYHIEIYHNSMIPEKIESLYIKEIDTIITSNEHAKKYDNTVVDLNKYMDIDKIDRSNYEVYEILRRNGIDSLSNAKNNHLILEKTYIPSVDYTGVDKVKAEILAEIMEKIKA